MTAGNNPLEIYRDADDATRAFLERGVVHEAWQDRQEKYLEWAGLAAGLLIALAFLTAASLLVASGHDVAGTFLGTVDIVALVTVFVLGRRNGNG